MQRLKALLKRNAGWFLVMAAIAGYIVISGKTGSCTTCVAITQIAGIVPSSKPVDPAAYERLGVGDALPDGVLTASDGGIVDVSDHLAESPAILVFYRGGWCPFCNRHLSAIVDIMPQLKELGVKLVGISPDRPSKLNAKPELSGLPYQLLSDSPMRWTSQLGIAFQVPDQLVEKYMKRYNIDLEGDSGETHHLLPHPSVFVVDRNGTIQFAHIDEDYKVRLDPQKILSAAKLVAK